MAGASHAPQIHPPLRTAAAPIRWSVNAATGPLKSNCGDSGERRSVSASGRLQRVRNVPRPSDERQRPRFARPWRPRSSLGIRPRTAGAAPHADGRDTFLTLRAVRLSKGANFRKTPPRGSNLDERTSSHECKLGARAGWGRLRGRVRPCRTRAPSVRARLPASSGRGRRPANAWGSAGFARRTPSREGMGTLSGFPSERWSREAPEAERAMDARSAAVGMRPLRGRPHPARGSRAPLSRKSGEPDRQETLALNLKLASGPRRRQRSWARPSPSPC